MEIQVIKLNDSGPEIVDVLPNLNILFSLKQNF